ncbi:uncharacterized protein UDID_19443 [Ustilago sp. UG-2017a]|nr:uncharacterized protein UDID_19443 [Ustilago sp. UG-2017a]
MSVERKKMYAQRNVNQIRPCISCLDNTFAIFFSIKIRNIAGCLQLNGMEANAWRFDGQEHGMYHFDLLFTLPTDASAVPRRSNNLSQHNSQPRKVRLCKVGFALQKVQPCSRHHELRLASEIFRNDFSSIVLGVVRRKRQLASLAVDTWYQTVVQAWVDGQNGTTQPKRSFSAEPIASIRVRKRLGSEKAVIHVLAATTQGGTIKDPGEEGDEHVALANRNPFVHSPWRGAKNALYCKRNMHISTAAKMRWNALGVEAF